MINTLKRLIGCTQLIHLFGVISLLFITTMPGLSQKQELNSKRDKLIRLLTQSKPDTAQINILLELGSYYLDKPGDLQTDTDSGTGYMKQAEAMSQWLGQKSGRVTPHHVQVLIKLGQFFCLKPKELPSDMATALRYAKQAERLSRSLHIPLGPQGMEMIGNINWETRDTNRAESYYNKAAKGYEQIKDTVKLAALWFEFGERYMHSPQNLAKKVNCYQRAFTYYHQLKKQDQEIKILEYIDYTFILQAKWEASLATMVDVLHLYQKENYPLLDYIYYWLSIIEVNRGNYQAGLTYNFKALQLALSNNRISRIGDYYEQISHIYRYLNEVDKRLVYSRKALYYYKKSNKLQDIHYEAGQICELLILKKKPAEAFTFYQSILHQYPASTDLLKIQSFRNLAFIYEGLQQSELAEFYFLKLLDSVKGYNDRDPTRLNAYTWIGNFYLNQKQYAKARYYFNWHFIHSKPLGHTRVLLVSYQNLFKIDSIQGRFQSALNHFQQYTAIKDSIFTAVKAKQIDELQIQYETQNKENRIALLTTQARVQQARVQQAQFTQNVTLGGAAMLLLLLGLIYNRYRLKQKQQAQIQLKNLALEELVGQKDWLVKEIHHRVKNNLQLIIGLLQSQSKYLVDEVAISAIDQSQHRVQAMALIHQKLYRPENLSRIDISAYIQEVAKQLSYSFDPEGRIVFFYDLEPLDLDVSQAIPLGLILNEAITNSFKYAFPANQTGSIHISLLTIDGDHHQLMVKDDGVGIPEGIDLQKSNSMGANIMRGLSKQLGGTLKVKGSPGVEISILFTVFHPQSILTYAT